MLVSLHSCWLLFHSLCANSLWVVVSSIGILTSILTAMPFIVWWQLVSGCVCGALAFMLTTIPFLLCWQDVSGYVCGVGMLASMLTAISFIVLTASKCLCLWCCIYADYYSILCALTACKCLWLWFYICANYFSISCVLTACKWLCL